MAIRRLSPKTQLHYIRHVKRFADFLGRSADKATAEDVHRYQLWRSGRRYRQDRYVILSPNLLDLLRDWRRVAAGTTAPKIVTKTASGTLVLAAAGV